MAIPSIDQFLNTPPPPSIDEFLTSRSAPFQRKRTLAEEQRALPDTRIQATASTPLEANVLRRQGYYVDPRGRVFRGDTPVMIEPGPEESRGAAIARVLALFALPAAPLATGIRTALAPLRARQALQRTAQIAAQETERLAQAAALERVGVPATRPPIVRPAVTSVSPPAVSFEEFAAVRGATPRGATVFEGARLPGASTAERKRVAALTLKHIQENARAVERARVEYNALIAEGKIRPPTSLEQLQATATGDPENVSVQAARRVLAKRAARGEVAPTPLIETKPVAPTLPLTGQEAQAPPIVRAMQEVLVPPPTAAGKARPMSDLGRLPVNSSIVMGNVPSAGSLHPAYDVAVRRNGAQSWTLSINTPRTSKTLGEFSSVKALAQRVDKILTEPKTFTQLVTARAARAQSARGGAETRLAREFSEGYAEYLQATGQVTAENLAEVAPVIAARAQAGAIRLAPRVPASAVISRDVEEMFRLGNPPLASRLQQAAQRSAERVRVFFARPGAELRGARTVRPWQEIVDDFRLFKGVPQTDVPRQVARDVIGVVAPLDRQEYQVFNRYIVLRELREEVSVAARQGRPPSVPLGIPEAQLGQNLQVLDAQLTPALRAAVRRHDALQQVVTNDLVHRGRLTAEQARAFYFRHFVLDYDALRESVIPAAPRGARRGLQVPGGEKARVGSQRAIQTDYVDVMQRRLSQYYLDNAAEDFIKTTQRKVDILPTLTQAERAAAFGPSGRAPGAGHLVDIPGRGRFVTWQPEPGNQLFPTYTVSSKIINGATQSALTAEELATLAQGVPPTAAGARQGLALGGPKPVWLVDPKVAKYLDTFNVGAKNGDLLRQATGALNIWKRGIVDSLGVPFQFRNAVGDIQNGFWIGNTPITTPLGKAARILIKDAYGGTLTAGEQATLAQARQLRVVGSGFTGHLRQSLREQSELAHLQDPLLRAVQLPGGIVRQYEKAFRVREDVARLASFMANTERIQAGHMVRTTGAIDITGLSPIRAAGKVAREAFVDYGNKSQFEQLGQMFAPFVTWYYQNARNWATLAVQDPARIALKVVPAYAAMFTWNNTGDRAKIEGGLPKWQRMMPHLITGWTLPDGRPLVISFGSDAPTGAAQVIGLTKAFDLGGQVARGEVTSAEALRALPTGMLTEAGRAAAFQVAGPLVTVPGEAILAVTSEGRELVDIRRGTTRVPERLAGTAEGKRQFWGQEARALIPPIDIALRQFSAAKYVPPDTPLTTRAMMATGAIRPVDLEAEARRRQVEASQKATAGLEGRLYRVEQTYIRTGDGNAAMRQAAELQLPFDTVASRLTSTRVQIDRTRQQMMRERNPSRARELRELLNQLLRKAEVERFQATPRAVRHQAAPRP